MRRDKSIRPDRWDQVACLTNQGQPIASRAQGLWRPRDREFRTNPRPSRDRQRSAGGSVAAALRSEKAIADPTPRRDPTRCYRFPRRRKQPDEIFAGRSSHSIYHHPVRFSSWRSHHVSPSDDYGWPKRERYSLDEMKALTISAFWKSPPNEFSFVSQN
jgi:hypothetical protein